MWTVPVNGDRPKVNPKYGIGSSAEEVDVKATGETSTTRPIRRT